MNGKVNTHSTKYVGKFRNFLKNVMVIFNASQDSREVNALNLG